MKLSSFLAVFVIFLVHVSQVSFSFSLLLGEQSFHQFVNIQFSSVAQGKQYGVHHLKFMGESCREDSDCRTNHCKKNLCTYPREEI